MQYNNFKMTVKWVSLSVGTSNILLIADLEPVLME